MCMLLQHGHTGTVQLIINMIHHQHHQHQQQQHHSHHQRPTEQIKHVERNYKYVKQT